jgi:hypothetical protein
MEIQLVQVAAELEISTRDEFSMYRSIWLDWKPDWKAQTALSEENVNHDRRGGRPNFGRRE